jgi:enoyl-CoA hydratase
MSEELVLRETRGAIAWVELNRPEAGNALTPGLIQILDTVFAAIDEEEAIRVVVLAGSGDDFCAGADIAALGAFDSYAARARFGRRMRRTGSVFTRIEKFPKPVIASVQGKARAGGLELMLCSDLVVAARSATFGDAHSPFGQLPGGGTSIRLPRRIGVTRAKYVLFTGDMIDAATMLEWGAINEVADDADLEGATMRLAERLAANSPASLSQLKRLVDAGIQQPPETALGMEIAAAEINLGSDDMAEGMRAIAEGRRPRFGSPAEGVSADVS